MKEVKKQDKKEKEDAKTIKKDVKTSKTKENKKDKIKKEDAKASKKDIKLNKTNKSKKIEKETKKKLEGPDLKEIEYEVVKESLHDNKKTSSIKIYILIIFLITLIILFIGMHLIIPTIKLIGDKEIEILYQETYVEKGAEASFFNEDLTKNIRITNNIDTNKVGTYEVVYTVKNSFYEVKTIRIVKVVDKENPIIVLEGKEEVKVCPKDNFKEIGYTATDNYDGNITDKVDVKITDQEVIYSVKDSSGNSYKTTRKIKKIDDEKPTITLKGNSTMYLGLEDNFIEPGYTASDNCSGNLTDRVKVTGSVASKQKGTYTLNYEVIDNHNNKTTIQRKVIISEKTNPNSGVVKNGTIYLTFDDGPSNVITGAILDILKEEGVKATFFVTNNGPDYLIKRMYDEGHTIGLHTASHNYSKIYSSVDNYFKDLESVSNRVKRITGQTSKIVRFPGGSSNTISRRYNKGIMTTLSQQLFNRGYRYYDWNVDSMDASTAKTSQAVYNNVVKNLSKNKANVILMHDIKVPTRNAIRDIIRYGKENGYTFDRIDMDTYMVRQRINN